MCLEVRATSPLSIHLSQETNQGTEDTLALGDGCHLLRWVLPEAQLAGHQGVEGQVPGGPVPCCGHRRTV